MFKDIDVPSPPGIMDSIAQSISQPPKQGGSPNINIVGGGGGGGGTSIPYDKMTVAQKIEYDKAMRGI